MAADKTNEISGDESVSASNKVQPSSATDSKNDKIHAPKASVEDVEDDSLEEDFPASKPGEKSDKPAENQSSSDGDPGSTTNAKSTSTDGPKPPLEANKPSASDEEEWDPAAESSTLKGMKAAVEKQSYGASEGQSQAADHGWQAIWAPQQNAYYFWNSKTNETTWQNPLASTSSDAASANPPLPNEPHSAKGGAGWGAAYTTGSTASAYSQPSTDGSGLPPIDPDLARLLPGGRSVGDYGQAAEFNARTGRFTAADYQFKGDYLEESNRAKRQQAYYYDVGEWESKKDEEWRKRKLQEIEAAAGQSGRSSNEPAKKLTKADMDRFRAKKQEKKARKMAWLRD